ncbi:MAG TPA: farnesyl diphosphate synthase [Tissierellales bacterium]|nr:farnesyl diphosphate synthase [Tissierellales bacterium]
MDLKQELEAYGNIVDEELNKLFINKNGYQKTVIESMEYSLFTGGKRLRPVLLLKSCEALTGDYKDAIPFALAMEMIHTYSLVHDDLPPMDNDDYRRGKKTNHRVYGEGMAILAGDGLLNLAYESTINYIIKNSNSKEDFERYIYALDVIAKSAGINGMIGGQVIDIESENENINIDTLHCMYENKTAALIKASAIAGGIIGKGNEKEIKSLGEFGLAIGLGYQIRDDILDLEEDKIANKTTYISFYKKNEAEKKVRELSLKAIKILEDLKGHDTRFLESFARYLINREY